MEGNGLNLIKVYILTFAWRIWGNPQRITMRIATVWAEILTCVLQNMKNECLPLSNNERYEIK
jgi:hypothetical protein